MLNSTPESRPTRWRSRWLPAVDRGRELSMVTKSGAKPWRFARFSGVITVISALIRFGNNHEGSLFTAFHAAVHPIHSLPSPYEYMQEKCK